MIYSKRIECFSVGYGRKGMDLGKHRPEQSMEIHELFMQEIDIRKNKADYFILAPALKNAIKLQKEGKLEKRKVLDLLDKINQIIDYNVAKGGKKGPKYGEASDAVAKAIPGGFLSCEEARTIFGPKYKEKPDDEGLWKSIFNSFRSAKCTEDPLFIEVTKKYHQKEPSTLKAKAIALGLVKQGKFSEAIVFFKDAIKLETDNSKKAELTLDLARIHAYKLNDFPTGRSYARKAAALKGAWGDPYLFIADLYASSAKLCGPGTGFDSQRVVWVAVDMYNKAKSIDSSVSGKANAGIKKFKEFMPTSEDGFMRGLKVGTSYLVPCWINESTIVRFAK